jgi:hypothetical protein
VALHGLQFRQTFRGHSFSARGSRGQFVLVVPGDDLVIVHRVDDDADRSREVKNDGFGALLEKILAARTG